MRISNNSKYRNCTAKRLSILGRWKTVTIVKKSITSNRESKDMPKSIQVSQLHRSNDLRGLHAWRPGCVWRWFGRASYGGWYPLRNCILGIQMFSAVFSRCLHQCCKPYVVDKVDHWYLIFDNYTSFVMYLNLRMIEHRIWIFNKESGWYLRKTDVRS